MKKTLYYLLIAILFIACSKQSTEPTDETIPDPINNYKFDVKTKFSEKMDVTGAKNGLISYIENAEWCDVVYTKEDYSIWIKNTKRITKDNNVTVTFDLELRTPAFLTEGDLIKSKTMTITYDKNAKWNDGKGSIDINALTKDLQKIVNIAKWIPIPQISSAAFIIDKILINLEPLMNSGEDINQKAEGVIVGIQSFIQLKQWILEIEK